MYKPRMKFMGRGSDGRLYWESTTQMPGDSRVVQYTCRAEWFYGTMLKSTR